MSNMISVASGFQYSVNIGYDLNNNDKIKNFIPTKAALDLLEDILLSTRITSTERARILIGAYGKGKSHIVLMILSILLKKDKRLFKKLLNKVKVESPQLYDLIINYYESNNKILPVVITGSSTSLTQAFLLALQRTLSDNDMMDIMPETNYKAACTVINRWKVDYPETYNRLIDSLDTPVDDFISQLEAYDSEAYGVFEQIYPSLTSGSMFNPFLGFDVVELYESATRSLKAHGYTGIYVVYDEFSKYLEANITKASVSDTKMLQDFAEKCNRSGSLQMHLMLISHKEISNYIDKLPKQKVDGWRGVSERFKHIPLINNFSQTYEVIGSVIQKNNNWDGFIAAHSNEFISLFQKYSNHPLFADINSDGLLNTLYSCYPLHPVSMFILPRLSEKVAQNERTLFTFLSADGNATLQSFLFYYDDSKLEMITPDIIYDYFEPLFRKELYEGPIHKIYILATSILGQLENGSLESKLVKTIALIYILEQYEKIKPTAGELADIYSVRYTVDEIKNAINTLVEQKYLMYLKRSNHYLQLKQSSGVDIRAQIQNTIESQRMKVSVSSTLNEVNFDNYLYPSRYNDEYEMTRYFSFKFIPENLMASVTSQSTHSDSDGYVYGILPDSAESMNGLKEKLLVKSTGCEQEIYVLPKHYQDIDAVVREYSAVMHLRNEAANDAVLFDEYEVIYEDLREVITDFIASYSHPEYYKAHFIYDGRERQIIRKAALSELLSAICCKVFPKTPAINNEAINKNEITSIATNSRSKIVSALLRNELEENLGLSGTGQEVSIMRSTLIRPNILEQSNGLVRINLHPSDTKLENLLSTIKDFVEEARQVEAISFAELYKRLTSAEYGIGLREGTIPIYLAAVLHDYKKNVIISDRVGQISINADALLQINADPVSYSLSYIDWDPEKEAFVKELEKYYAQYIIESEKNNSQYDYVINAMRRWYLGLPRYSKECKDNPNGGKIATRYQALLKALRQSGNSYHTLFVKLPEACKYQQFNAGLADTIFKAKEFYDHLIDDLKKSLVKYVKETFTISQREKVSNKDSLTSILEEWCDSLDPAAFDYIFPNGTERCITLFRTIANDDETFIVRLAKTLTDLRIEDWDDSFISKFKDALVECKKTAEAFRHSSTTEAVEAVTSGYQIAFINSDGQAITKNFDHVDRSRRSQLLYNQITAAISSMGTSITEQEKRQVLMEILQKLF